MKIQGMLTDFSQTGAENPQGDDEWRFDARKVHDEDVNPLGVGFFSMMTVHWSLLVEIVFRMTSESYVTCKFNQQSLSHRNRSFRFVHLTNRVSYHSAY